MATYDLPRAQAMDHLAPAVSSFLASQIQAAIDGPARAGGGLSVVYDFVPGSIVPDGTDVVIVRPGAGATVSVPAHVGAIVFAGSDSVAASLSVEASIAVKLGDGSDFVSMSAPAGGWTDLVVSVDLGAGDDLFIGARDARNHVVGGEGDDRMIGGARNDLFDVGHGSDTVDAGAGYDRAFVHGGIDDYSSVIGVDGSLILTHKASGAVTTLANLEFLTFEDGAVMLNVTSEAGYVAASLYEVILGRSADPVVHEHFAQADTGRLIEAANLMLGSQEFAETFGPASELTDAAFIEIIYGTSFERPADPEGLSYWLDKLASGMSRGEVAVHFAGSAEAHAGFSAIINVIDRDHPG